MILYHGSEKIIFSPQHDFRNSANDYGSGFYCTEEIELAGEWACKKNRNGFINRYELDETGLSVCNLNSDEWNIFQWLALLTRYRGYWQRHSIAEDAKSFLQENYLPDISKFDLIVGYRADDSYFSFVQDFISGTISVQKLSEAMHLGKLGEQIVLKSEKAFSQLRYVESEEALASEYYALKANRDLTARRAYAETKKHRNVNEDYILDFMRGRVRIEDARL